MDQMEVEWNCQACTFLNEPGAKFCQMCETGRPVHLDAKAAEILEAEWQQPGASSPDKAPEVPGAESQQPGTSSPDKASEVPGAESQQPGTSSPDKESKPAQVELIDTDQEPKPAQLEAIPIEASETAVPASSTEAFVPTELPTALKESADALGTSTDVDMTPSSKLAARLAAEEEESGPYEDPRFGKALSRQQLKEMNVFFEMQEPESDTCAQKALNNLAQHHLFSIEDLGQAEVAQGDGGGWGMDLDESQNSVGSQMRTGFFDVEAVKRAAAKKGLQVVDVEPRADYRESELPKYLAGCGGVDESGTSKGSPWLKGFLVYDTRPGHSRHFYAIVVRPGRQFVVLNSIEEEYGAQNRLITEEELWHMHEHYAPDFRSWVFRWYPVVNHTDAVSALKDTLHADDPRWSISDDRAERVIQACRWQVLSAAHRLLQEDVLRVLSRFRAGRLVVPRSVAEAELEAADGDARKAAERLADVLLQQASVEMPEDSVARRALNAASWSVDGAVSVLELAGNDTPEDFEAMRDILQRVDWHFDNAVKVRKVLKRASSKVDENEPAKEQLEEPRLRLDVEGAATLLEACSWNVEESLAVAVVQKGCPGCPVPIVRTVLRRNDGDSRAAIEMLKDFKHRVCAYVARCAKSLRAADVNDEDVGALATSALDLGGWNPAVVLDHSRRLTDFVVATKAICAHESQPHVPAAGILWALQECGEVAIPEVAARVLLHGEEPDVAAQNVRHRKGKLGGAGQQEAKLAGKGGDQAGKGKPAQGAPPGKGGPAPKAKAKGRPKRLSQQDDSYDCSLM